MNSLVDVQVEFNHGLELKEKKTAEVYEDIEDMIRARVLNEAFDDPRFFTYNESLENKEEVEIDFAKDKKGLASYYEEDYKRKMLGLPTESKEDKTKSDALELFRELNTHLDQMTNMTYTPYSYHKKADKKVGKDIQVIQLEEKTPITVRDVDAVNPKADYQANAKEFLGENEKTNADGQRVRRIVKRRIRAKLKVQRKKDLAKEL